MPKEIEIEEEDTPPAPKRGRPRKSTEDVIFGDEIDGDEEKRLREEREISQLLEQEDASTATIIVGRRFVRTQKYAHLAEIGLRDYNREELAKQYGGGDYRCRLRRSDGTFGLTWYFSVDHTRKPDVEPGSMGTPMGMDAVRLVETMAEKFGKKDDGSIVQMLNQKSDQMMQMFMAMSQENTKLMAGMMTAMAQAFSSKPSSDGNLGQMSAMLLKHSLDQSQTRMDDMISTIIKLKKLADDNDKDEDEEEPEKGSFIQDLVSAIPQVIKSVTSRGQAVPEQAGQPLPPNGAMVPQPPMAMVPQPRPMPTPKDIGLNGLLGNLDPQVMSMVLMNLNTFATANANPEDVHNSYEPMLTEESYDQIAEFLEKHEDWFERLSAFYPDMAPHKAWFSELRDIILDVPEDDDREESEPIGEEHEVAAQKLIDELSGTLAPPPAPAPAPAPAEKPKVKSKKK